MSIPNRQRALVTLLREIAAEEGYGFHSFSQDWILRLEKGGRARHVFGYTFEINSATARMLAADKAATSDLLTHSGIPCVEHRLFLHPKLAGYVSSRGNWDMMQAYARQHGYPLVVKPNEGTGGEDIVRVDSALELEQAVAELFEKQRAICFSPFLEIEQEYRVIVLDEQNQLIYAKQWPTVLGDGQSSILQLIERLHLAGKLNQAQAARLIEGHRGDLKQIPTRGQEVALSWKHNLGEGALPQLVQDSDLLGELGALAQAARRVINIRFASVDIVQVGGVRTVLEINAGVMMEYFLRHFPGERPRVKAIYAKAVEKMFAAG